jgi:bifunctional DNase/RNase
LGDANAPAVQAVGAELPTGPLVEPVGDPPVATTTAPLDESIDSPASEPIVHFRVMNVESVLFDLVDPSPLVHLMEAEEPYRYMAIPIALPEAMALNSALAGIEGRRPGTHELFSSVLARLQCDVIAVRIVRYEVGVFYAEIDVMSPRGREVFDCRTSDGLILAARQGVRAPVLCAEEVLASFYAESN